MTKPNNSTAAPGKNGYLDFDSLYDTRIGTVALMDEDKATTLLEHKDYKVRIIDDFSKILDGWSHRAYVKEYDQRDLATLIMAPITDLMFQLNGIIAEMNSGLGMIEEDPEARPVIFVNHYPYTELTPEEVEAYRECICAHVGGYFEIEMICVPFKDLSMTWWVKHGVGWGFIYDYATWESNLLNGVNHDRIPMIPQTSITFFKRTLDMAKLKIQMDYTNETGEKIDPFIAESYFKGYFIGVRWTGSDVFSAADISLHLRQ